MRTRNRIVVLGVFVLFVTFGLQAQQKEYKKLVKGGLTVESLEEFIGQFPDFAPAHLKLADEYSEMEPEKAIQHYEKAYAMMNDEETKANRKFYEDYKQRDFRSGKIILKTDYLKEYIEEMIEKNKALL